MMKGSGAEMEGLVPDNELTCLSTFTGLGGMDLGLEAAGFKNVGCVEWDEAARRSLKANRGDKWNLLPMGDIQSVAGSLQPRDLGMAVGDLALLSGAPPCQPYSKAAEWVAGGRQGLGDRRGQYLDDYLRLLATFMPKVALLENVRGFLSGRTSALQHISGSLDELERLTGIRYRVEHRVLDAADHGVAQHRARAIVVLTRLDFPLTWPDLAPTRTAWDAIGREEFNETPPKAVGKWAELLPSIPEGKNYLWHTDRGGGERLFGYRTRYWSFLLKLTKDAPSWTLPAQPGPATGPFHWENRPLRLQEMLCLQSFPIDWVVEGNGRTEKVKQIGNATPPLLAEAIGLSIAAHIRNDPEPPAPSRLVIERRLPVPAPASPKRVPSKYLELVGDHPAHPGQGLGPGAAAGPRIR